LKEEIELSVPRFELARVMRDTGDDTFSTVTLAGLESLVGYASPSQKNSLRQALGHSLSPRLILLPLPVSSSSLHQLSVIVDKSSFFVLILVVPEHLLVRDDFGANFWSSPQCTLGAPNLDTGSISIFPPLHHSLADPLNFLGRVPLVVDNRQPDR
jgi:hypothetical protein